MDHLLDLNGRCCTRLYQLRTKSFVRERISPPYTDTRMTYTHRGVGCNASATTAAATPVVDLNDDYRRDREPPDPSLTLTSEVLGRPVHADSRFVELDPRLLVIDPEPTTARSRKPHAKPTHVQRIALVSVLFHVQYASW